LFKTPTMGCSELSQKLTIVCFLNNHLLNYQTHKIAICTSNLDVKFDRSFWIRNFFNFTDANLRKTKPFLFVSLPQRWWRAAINSHAQKKNRFETDALFIIELVISCIFHCYLWRKYCNYLRYTFRLFSVIHV
jgi:hypothetical protein